MSVTVNRLNADKVGPPQLLPAKTPAAKVSQTKTSFADHLQRACEEVGCKVNFSSHAEERAENRHIDLNPEQLSRLNKAVDSAASKGAKKALVMLDDLALIVGINKRTVITLVDSDGLRDSVFTSIDAAVIG